jgi:parallel beta-helix repeat protein
MTRPLSLPGEFCYRDEPMRHWCQIVIVLLCAAATVAPPIAAAATCGDAQPCQCGDVVEGRYRLRENLGPCPADGLTLRGGAVLDCAGHTIQGSGDPHDGVTGEATVGITLRGTVGAVVRNCTVTGFRTGVTFREAQRSTIMNSTIARNGNFRSRVGYGIHLSRALENTVMECTVRENADEGIHVGTGSHGNALISNEAHDNGRENFYVLSAERTQIVSNRAGGKVSANLYLKHASGSRVADNRFEGRPVVVRGSASGNQLVGNAFNGGLAFRAYPDWSTEARPTRNVVRGGELAGTPCLAFIDASENRVEGASVARCGRVVARSQELTVNEMVGIPLERIPLDLAGGATMRLLAPLRVRVSGPTGMPIAGATIRLRRRTGDVVAAPATDPAGVAEFEIPTHTVSAGGLATFTPIRMTVQADGYPPRDTELADPLPPAVTVDLGGAE